MRLQLIECVAVAVVRFLAYSLWNMLEVILITCKS